MFSILMVARKWRLYLTSVDQIFIQDYCHGEMEIQEVVVIVCVVVEFKNKKTSNLDVVTSSPKTF